LRSIDQGEMTTDSATHMIQNWIEVKAVAVELPICAKDRFESGLMDQFLSNPAAVA